MEEIETLEWMEYELRLIDIEKSLIDNDYLLPAIEKVRRSLSRII